MYSRVSSIRDPMNRTSSITRQGYVVLGGIGILYVLILGTYTRAPSTSFSSGVIRLSALIGLLSLSIATLMTPFLRQIYTLLGRPFMTVHHIFALSGLIFATVHPLSIALSRTDFSIFIPVLDSWSDFWRYGGRQALILLYIALVFGVFRKKITIHWRLLHALTYLVLLFGFIHGWMIGTDFILPLSLLYSALLLCSIGTLAYNRIRQLKRE